MTDQLKPECKRTRAFKNWMVLFGLYLIGFGGVYLYNNPIPYSSDWIILAGLGAIFVGIGVMIPTTYVEID